MATDPLASTFGGWQAVENAALALTESTNLLLIPGRNCANGLPVPLNDPAWSKFVQELRDAGVKAYKAAQSKDQDKMVDAANRERTRAAMLRKMGDVERFVILTDVGVAPLYYVREAILRKAHFNVFQVPGNDQASVQTPMYGRGRLDHFGLNARSREDLEEVRQRLMRLGASDGTVTDFGKQVSVFFRDPDGLEAEVVWIKDAAALADSNA